LIFPEQVLPQRVSTIPGRTFYVVTNKTGTQPDSGLLDQAGTGPRFFSRKATDVQVWVGTTGWDAAEETRPDNGDEEETV
jgi:type VI secretion system secreted protein VgrG